MPRVSSRWVGFMVLLVASAAVSAAQAEVKLPHIFGSHMVLQREMPLPIWGWADPQEQVKVQLGDQPAVTTTADAAGKWQVKLPPTPAGGPFKLTVTGKNEIVLNDVLVGEVWLCSGQSNMELPVTRCLNADQEIAHANFPQIREIKVPRVSASYPAPDFTADWQVCSPATVGAFTAAGYFFGRKLNQDLKVPIGLINSSWGGTRIEPWIPPVGFQKVPSLDDFYQQMLLVDPRSASHKQALSDYLTAAAAWLKQAHADLAAEKPVDPPPDYPAGLKPLAVQAPSTLYNGMIHPLLPLAIRGAIWYQGESNHRDGKIYTDKMKALIGGWRTLWGEGDFPFYFVQIAPYDYGHEDPYYLPAFWEAQAAATAIPNTGMVVTTDIGDLTNIHPKNKQEVGRRLALLALAGAYGQKNVVCCGPTFKSLALEGDKLRVVFDHADNGLKSRDGKPLDWFEIIGKNTDFEPATATIDGDAVVLSSPKVKAPVAVRFGWNKAADPNLVNGAGLPAVPFRAGKVPQRDYLALNVAEARDYQLVYSLDLAKAGRVIKYDVDNSAKITRPFDRIAYFLELQKDSAPVQWVYVSMDAFTHDLAKIGVPTLASKAFFQCKVSNMDVVSNVPGIAVGGDIKTGNIEFWPGNYGPGNSAHIPNASATLWDFGDQPSVGGEGYGSMQVNNYGAKQTIFAFNHWTAGNRADIGIGNSTGKTRDWTFTGNAGSYTLKRLRVLVREKK